MSRLIFNVKQCFIPNTYLATVTFPNFGVDWAKSFQCLRIAHLKLLYYFKVFICVRQGSPQCWPQNKTSISSDSKDDMGVSLSSTVPRISDILRRKQAQKSHW